MHHRLKLPRSYVADRTLLAVLIATGAWLGLTVGRGSTEVAPIWVGNGILAGWLLSRRTCNWPGYLAVAFVAEWAARSLTGDAPWRVLSFTAINQIETLLVASVVRWRVPDTRDPSSWLRLGGIATAASLLACAVSGALAGTLVHLAFDQTWLPAAGRWFAAHMVGMVVMATTTLVAQREGLGLFVAPGRRWSLAGTLALVAALTGLTFTTPYPLLFLTYPPLLLAAVRHRFAGVGLGVITLAAVATYATAHGVGPLWMEGLDRAGRIALLQLYIAGACVMTLPVSLAMAERDRLASRLRESEARYRMLADHSHDAIIRIRADGERVYVSPSASEMLGWSTEELAGAHWDFIHPDDLERQQQALRHALATGEPSTDIYRLRHRDGHYVWIEAVSRGIPPGDAEPGLIVVARNIDRRVAIEQALAESRNELERQTRVDALTELANRRQLDERLQLATRRAGRSGLPLSLLSLDIDRFKQINDTHGHLAGDAVLRTFGERLCASVRGTDLVARLGGDEFVILLEDEGLPAAEAVAKKILQAMAAPVEADGLSIPVATSIGIACTTEPIDTTTLLARADAALYAAKRSGRNRYEVAAPAAGDLPAS